MQRKIPELDGVRGVAILVVLVHNLHAFSSSPFSLLCDYGWLLVDLIFVLSGFLITGILLDRALAASARCTGNLPALTSSVALSVLLAKLLCSRTGLGRRPVRR